MKLLQTPPEFQGIIADVYLLPTVSRKMEHILMKLVRRNSFLGSILMEKDRASQQPVPVVLQQPSAAAPSWMGTSVSGVRVVKLVGGGVGTMLDL